MLSHPALLHLLHLVSPALPVGAYAYSQGLESAIENGWVTNRVETQTWLGSLLSENLAQLDLPVLMRLMEPPYDNLAGTESLQHYEQWNDFLLASRETQELWLEDTQLGQALLRLLVELDVDSAVAWQDNYKNQKMIPTSFVIVFSMAAQHFNIDSNSALMGFAWSWLENQVQAAIKLVPLGQTDAQKILVELMPSIEQSILMAKNISDDEIGNSLPRLAIASMQHETQYSRLFRS